MPRFLKRISVIILLCTLPATLQVMAQTADAQWFKVEVTGEGTPMILIPGLSSSGDVWNQTVAHFRDQFECHVFTLAGFAGVPPVESEKFLPVVKDKLIQYMEENLDEPAVIIGHSLGGFLVYWIGSERPDLLKAAISIDGPPWLGGVMFDDMDAKKRQKSINAMLTGMRNQTDAQFQALQPMIFSSMIHNPDTAAAYSKWGQASNHQTVVKAYEELFKINLADQLSTMAVPTLHLYAWAPYTKYGATKESVGKTLKKQTRLHPNITFATHDSAWHFMMIDEPEWFFGEVEVFLKSILQQ